MKAAMKAEGPQREGLCVAFGRDGVMGKLVIVLIGIKRTKLASNMLLRCVGSADSIRCAPIYLLSFWRGLGRRYGVAWNSS